MKTALLRFWPQPLIGTISAAGALGALAAALAVWPLPADWQRDLADSWFALCLIGAVILAYHFPIRVRNETKVYLNSVPLFMIAALLPVGIAVAAIALAKLAGELVERSRTGAYSSDIATQAGRWTLVGLAGAAVAHAGSGDPISTPALLFTSALILWLGDTVTSPLLFCPATGETPRAVITVVAREAGPVEGAQYLFGILGAVAAAQARWTVVLMVVPMALMHLAFKHAKDVREAARLLLASVVDTAPEAILVLDLDGKTIVANRHAASLYGCAAPEEVAGRAITDAIPAEKRSQLLDDLRLLATGAMLPPREYTMIRADGSVFLAELTWSPVRDHRGTLTSVSAIARDVTDRKQAEQALAHQAQHDALTGLPNRTLFHDRLLQAFQDDDPHSFALFLIDLDRFKAVNDTFGHRYGDGLLRQAALRMQAALRDSDTIARLGGDEFGVLLPKVARAEAEAVAARLLASLTAPFAIDGQVLDVGASIGIAVYPEHGADPDILLERADLAMYAAKRDGDGFRLWAPAADSPPSLISATTH